MPNFMLGFASRARVIWKFPVPIRPMLPAPKRLANVSPFSERASSWMLPDFAMSRSH